MEIVISEQVYQKHKKRMVTSNFRFEKKNRLKNAPIVETQGVQALTCLPYAHSFQYRNIPAQWFPRYRRKKMSFSVMYRFPWWVWSLMLRYDHRETVLKAIFSRFRKSHSAKPFTKKPTTNKQTNKKTQNKTKRKTHHKNKVFLVVFIIWSFTMLLCCKKRCFRIKKKKKKKKKSKTSRTKFFTLTNFLPSPWVIPRDKLHGH